jgi:hypothetical protein
VYGRDYKRLEEVLGFPKKVLYANVSRLRAVYLNKQNRTAEEEFILEALTITARPNAKDIDR